MKTSDSKAIPVSPVAAGGSGRERLVMECGLRGARLLRSLQHGTSCAPETGPGVLAERCAAARRASRDRRYTFDCAPARGVEPTHLSSGDLSWTFLNEWRALALSGRRARSGCGSTPVDRTTSLRDAVGSRSTRAHATPFFSRARHDSRRSRRICGSPRRHPHDCASSLFGLRTADHRNSS